LYNLIVMNSEMEYLKRDISDIKKKVEGIDEQKAGQARLEGHTEGMKELVKGMSERVKAAEQKTEKTDKMLSLRTAVSLSHGNNDQPSYSRGFSFRK